MENTFYVYEHWRPDKDVCFYVGKGRGKRSANLHARNQHHKRIRAKLDGLGLCVDIRILMHDLSEAEAFDVERQRIAFWHGQKVPLANITNGGEGLSGVVRSAETRRKISEANKGKKRTPEQNAAMRAAKKPFTKEALARIGTASQGRRPRLGMKATGKTRARLREIGLANASKFAEFSAMGPAALARPVLCIDDGVSFRSASEAARHYGIAKSALIELCLDRRHRKTVGGRRFKYADAA